MTDQVDVAARAGTAPPGGVQSADRLILLRPGTQAGTGTLYGVPAPPDTSAALAAEATARQSAEAALSSAITAETSARQTADATLAGGLANESTARQAADAAAATATANALAGKAAVTHGHTIAQVTGLQGALDGKASVASVAAAVSAVPGVLAQVQALSSADLATLKQVLGVTGGGTPAPAPAAFFGSNSATFGSTTAVFGQQ